MLRRVLVGVALAATAASLAACGGTAGGNAQAAVARAATTTSSGQSFQVVSTTTLRLPGSSQAVTLEGEGAFDPKTQRGRLALDLSQLSVLLRAQAGTARMIVNGSVVYLRIPFLSASLPGLKPWLKVDLAKAARVSGIDLSSFLQLGRGGDPTETLRYLRAAGEVKKVGTETVRGVVTTHYRATIDLDKVPSTVAPSQRAQARDAVRRLEQATGVRRIPVDVWVDGQNRVRRLRLHETLNLGTGTADVTVDTQLYDFGASVVATPPPASEVSDLTRGA